MVRALSRDYTSDWCMYVCVPGLLSWRQSVRERACGYKTCCWIWGTWSVPELTWGSEEWRVQLEHRRHFWNCLMVTMTRSLYYMNCLFVCLWISCSSSFVSRNSVDLPVFPLIYHLHSGLTSELVLAWHWSMHKSMSHGSELVSLWGSQVSRGPS